MANAIVIGAGFGGIAAALRLRAKGYQVTIVDRCAQLGGRAQVFERKGFRHDAGPTVITAPFLFEELFALFGERFSDHVKLVPLTPWYRFHFADNTHFDYGGTLQQTLAEIERIEPRDVAGYSALLAQSKRIFEVGFTGLSATSFHQFKTMLQQIPRLIGLRSYETVWNLVSRHLSNDKLRRAFSIQPLLVGGNPFETTSIYGLIHYLERAYGVFFALGGTGAITKALGQLMQRQGIELRLSTTVASLTVANKAVTGVVFESGETLAANVVVSNADPTHLYRAMVSKADLPGATRWKVKSAQFSMGLFVLYFGTSKTYPNVAHHTIWMGERYRELLDDIFNKKILPEDFSMYLHRPTATDPSFAPTGCDSFYVLCPVPNQQGAIDWETEGPRLQARIIKALGETILPELETNIVEPFFMTPNNFQHDYLSTHGAGFSIAPLFRQSAWFRFHNRSEGLKNLYLVGAGTHPGAGLPGVLCSAKVLDSLIPQVAPT
jgi:phytoene desaturase